MNFGFGPETTAGFQTFFLVSEMGQLNMMTFGGGGGGSQGTCVVCEISQNPLMDVKQV